MIQTERLINVFLDLCKIPSPSGKEGRVARYIHDWAGQRGIEFRVDNAGEELGSDTGNLYLRTPGVGKPFFLSAHIDTVPVPFEDEIPVVVEGDVVHTAGKSPLGGDDKAGVAVALEMLELGLQNPGAIRPLEVILSIQEERGLKGSGLFDTNQVQAREGLVLDSSSKVGSAIQSSPYKVSFGLEIQGRSAHAAVSPEKGVHAVRCLAEIIAALPCGRISPTAVMNIAKIEGGGATNIVPDLARLTGEVRSMERTEYQKVILLIQETADRIAARYGAQARLHWEEQYAGFVIGEDLALSQTFKAACVAEGLEPVFMPTMGGSDANQYNLRGLSCLDIGLDVTDVHSPKETARLSSLVRVARLVERMLS